MAAKYYTTKNFHYFPGKNGSKLICKIFFLFSEKRVVFGRSFSFHFGSHKYGGIYCTYRNFNKMQKTQLPAINAHSKTTGGGFFSTFCVWFAAGGGWFVAKPCFSVIDIGFL